MFILLGAIVAVKWTYNLHRHSFMQTFRIHDFIMILTPLDGFRCMNVLSISITYRRGCQGGEIPS